MDEAEVERHTERFLFALREDPNEFMDFALYVVAQRLLHQHDGDLDIVVPLLLERGFNREEATRALKVHKHRLRDWGWLHEVVWIGSPNAPRVKAYVDVVRGERIGSPVG